MVKFDPQWRPDAKNQLPAPGKADYRIEVTPAGSWRRFQYENGATYQEFTSHADFLGWPLVHYTSGICPETGRRKTACGFFAVGRRALGFFAVGQLALGVVAIGQLALGLMLGLGQLTTGVAAVGQAAIGLLFGLGQAATGALAIGQFSCGLAALGQLSVGYYVYAVHGWGVHLWTLQAADPAAQQFFQWLR